MVKIFGWVVLLPLILLSICIYLFLMNGNYIAAMLVALYFVCIFGLAVLVAQSMVQAAPTASEPKDKPKNEGRRKDAMLLNGVPRLEGQR